MREWEARDDADQRSQRVTFPAYAVATRVNPGPIAFSAAAGVGAAAAAAAWGAVYPTSQLFGPAFCHTPRRTQIALTFDDGPNPDVTPPLLALLERHSVHATFFLVGRFARACPDLAREIAARGHTIGNHTETHANLALASARRAEDELRRCQDSVAGAIGRGDAGVPAWLRPPFGYRRPHVWKALRRTGLRGLVMWSLTCYDWKPQPPERLIRRLECVVTRQGVRLDVRSGGEIVLLHDGDFRQLRGDRGHILPALEHWLPRWRDTGFQFVTMDEVAGAAPIRA